MQNVNITEWDIQDFQQAKDAWTDLLVRSDADPLFMSWEWLHTWWEVFSEPSMQLKIFAASDDTNRLIGLAPLYLSKTTTKKIITSRRLQIIGNCWRGKSTMKTELMSFIADRDNAKQIILSLFQHINEQNDWDELVLSDLPKNSSTYQLLSTQQVLPNCYTRNAEEYDSFYIKTACAFEAYLKQLGKNTRLRIYNRRKILEKLGTVQFEINGEDEITTKLNLLNELHSKRWGNAIFTGKSLAFNQKVAELMAKRDALCFSTISLNGKPLSIQYNYQINGHKYNIQSGFNPDVHKKIALGYLHFGYEIENSCNSETFAYDMLAGDGQNSSYKDRLTSDHIQIINIQIIRSPLIKFLYRMYNSFSK